MEDAWPEVHCLKWIRVGIWESMRTIQTKQQGKERHKAEISLASREFAENIGLTRKEGILKRENEVAYNRRKTD